MEKLGATYYINVKVIEIATGETIYSDMLTIQDKAFMTIQNFEEYLAERKYPSTALFRSALIPGWGQLYNDQPVKASLFGGSAIVSLAVDIYLYNQYQSFINNTDEDVNYSEDLQKAKEYNSYLLISTGITLSVWVLNMLDAYISANH
jgi:TM2 domain-containing membrane protein YozV